MMNEIMIAIHPEFAEKIFKGIKKYEYRKQKPRGFVDTLIIYATKPIGKVVGEVEVEYIYSHSPYMIWQWTRKHSGMSYEQYFKYFVGKRKAYAYKLGKVTKYDKPKKISDFGIKKAPQSFVYIKRKEKNYE